jgi:hypothetical protein
MALAPEAAKVAKPRTVESADADQRDAMRCMSVFLHVLAGICQLAGIGEWPLPVAEDTRAGLKIILRRGGESFRDRR